MSSGQHFCVEPDELHTHAGTLDGVADRVEQAAAKGHGVAFGVETFGLVGQLFSIEARRVSGEAVTEMTGYAEEIRSMATGVRNAADVYQGMDDVNRSCFASGEG